MVSRCVCRSWSTWSAVINRTSRAGELRSAPSGPDDWHRVAGKRALAQGVRVRRAITRLRGMVPCTGLPLNCRTHPLPRPWGGARSQGHNTGLRGRTAALRVSLSGGILSQEVRHEDAHEDRWPDLHREASPIILLLSLSFPRSLSLPFQSDE